MSPNTFVNPSTLSLPTTSAMPDSPVASTSAEQLTSQQNPRKRPRSDASPDERKEARAHRNRIAAQNSRDRRKAQFVYLERRVAELEEENRLLRAGMNVPPSSTPSPTEEQRGREKELAREKENEELRERIRTLEKGWNAVVQALAAQGLPTGLPTPPVSTATSVSPAAVHAPSPSPSPSLPSPPTFPTMIPQSTPSPAMSTSSLFSETSIVTTPSSVTLPSHSTDTTRHLAAGGIEQETSSASSTAILSSLEAFSAGADDATMDDLFREILAAPADGLLESPTALNSTGALPEMIGWQESSAEMQRLLDMLPDVRQTGNGLTDGAHTQDDASKLEFPSALDLQLGGGWEETDNGLLMSAMPPSVGVF